MAKQPPTLVSRPDTTMRRSSRQNDKLAVALGQNYELTIVDLATGTRKPFSLARTPLETHVVWSPEGKWLAYTAELSEKSLGIHIIATDGRTQSRHVYTCHADPCVPASWSGAISRDFKSNPGGFLCTADCVAEERV